jgi:SAM-dependent methyltransferase
VRISGYFYVEPDAAAAADVASAPARFPVHRAGTIGDLPRELDVVFLNHVLEHVAEPVVFLRTVLERLREGGLLYVETPHADHRFKDDVFPHLYFFTPAALTAMAPALSVQVLACEAFGRWPAPRASLVGIAQRIASRLLPLGIALQWGTLQRALDRAIWRYAAAPDGIWLRWVLRKAG